MMSFMADVLGYTAEPCSVARSNQCLLVMLFCIFNHFFQFLKSFSSVVPQSQHEVSGEEMNFSSKNCKVF